MSSHAFFAPSSAEQWGNCAVAAGMIAAYPQPPTEESMEGDLAHAWAHYELVRRTRPGYPPIAPDTPATEEMQDAVDIYVRECMELLDPSHSQHVYFERGVEIPRVHESLCAGTFDFALVDWTTEVLYLRDFKYGFDGVEAYENKQMLLYAIGLSDLLKLDDTRWRVNLGIVQPRYYRGQGVKPWEIPMDLLRSYCNQLHHAAALAMRGDAAATTGSWCRHCPGRHACKPALDLGVRLYEMSYVGLPDPLSGEALGVQLSIVRRAIKHLEALDVALTADADARLRQGYMVPGWQLENVPGRLTWVDPDAALAALPKHCKTAPITPTQAIAAGANEELVNALAKRKSTTKLNPLTPAMLARVFPPLPKIRY